MRAGRNVHCRAAARADWSKAATDRTVVASTTLPLRSTVTWTSTVPSNRARGGCGGVTVLKGAATSSAADLTVFGGSPAVGAFSVGARKTHATKTLDWTGRITIERGSPATVGIASSAG